ncbi:DNA-directed RNA polymerases IV and V subunit 4-like isoform X2 [Carex rostrata]
MEKGGKGHPAGKGKTPFKVVASKRGPSSGREREPVNASPVEIDSDSDSEGFIEEIDFSKSNGKLSLKGKDGKGFSSGKAGGKGGVYSSSKKPPKRDTDVKLQLETPSGARVVMDCEAADILQQIQEQMVILSEDPTIKFPLSFDKAYQYTKEGKQYSDTKSVKDVLESLKNCGVNDGEICMIANSGPETMEEVYALIPSLKENRYENEEPIKEALSNLSKVKLPK